MTVCILALLAGSVLALWAPVAQFVCGLVLVALAGATVAIVGGASLLSVVGWTVALSSIAQVGYGLGVAAITAYASRRTSPTKTTIFPRLHRLF